MLTAAFWGEILMGQSILVYLSWILAVAASAVIYRTPLGLRLRGTRRAPLATRIKSNISFCRVRMKSSFLLCL